MNRYETPTSFQTRVHREVKLLRLVEHPNIVQYYDDEWVGDRTAKIYTEYLEDGNLEHYLRQKARYNTAQIHAST